MEDSLLKQKEFELRGRADAFLDLLEDLEGSAKRLRCTHSGFGSPVSIFNTSGGGERYEKVLLAYRGVTEAYKEAQDLVIEIENLKCEEQL